MTDYNWPLSDAPRGLYTESRAPGERRPMWSNPSPTRVPAFSTGSFTDPRMLDQTAGTYYGDLVQNILNTPRLNWDVGYNPLNPVTTSYETQGEANSRRQNDERAYYNRSYGPGGTSSRPRYPTNARDKVREGAEFLKSALGKRSARREGGTPTGKGR